MKGTYFQGCVWIVFANVAPAATLAVWTFDAADFAPTSVASGVSADDVAIGATNIPPDPMGFLGDDNGGLAIGLFSLSFETPVFDIAVRNSHPTESLFASDISFRMRNLSQTTSFTITTINITYRGQSIELQDFALSDDWVTYSFALGTTPLELVPGEELLVFSRGLGDFDGYSAVVDDITLTGTPVPEPGSALLLMGAVVSLGFQRRRG